MSELKDLPTVSHRTPYELDPVFEQMKENWCRPEVIVELREKLQLNDDAPDAKHAIQGEHGDPSAADEQIPSDAEEVSQDHLSQSIEPVPFAAIEPRTGPIYATVREHFSLSQDNVSLSPSLSFESIELGIDFSEDEDPDHTPTQPPEIPSRASLNPDENVADAVTVGPLRSKLLMHCPRIMNILFLVFLILALLFGASVFLVLLALL